MPPRARRSRLTRTKTPTVARASPCRDDERRGERDALLAQEPEILHDPDAGRHEEERERAEQPRRRPAEVAGSQRLVVKRPEAAGERERGDQEGEPDHRSGRRKVEAPRQPFADELEEKQEEEPADHERFSPQARGEVNVGGRAPAPGLGSAFNHMLHAV